MQKKERKKKKRKKIRKKRCFARVSSAQKKKISSTSIVKGGKRDKDWKEYDDNMDRGTLIYFLDDDSENKSKAKISPVIRDPVANLAQNNRRNFVFPTSCVLSSVVEIINRACPRSIIESQLTRYCGAIDLQIGRVDERIRFVSSGILLLLCRDREPHDPCLYIGARKKKETELFMTISAPKNFLISSIARGRMPTTIFSSHSILYFRLL